MAFAFGDEAPEIWIRGDGREWPLRALQHVADGGIVVAHNAAFEWVIWNCICVPKYGWPPLRIEQMRCTMAQAYAMALPGALEKVAPALGIEQRKDMAGQRIMMQLARPKSYLGPAPDERGWQEPEPVFWKPSDDPEKFQRLYDYCKTDVIVEREVDRRTMRLSPEEQRLWILDQRINQRGVQVDLRSIDAAIALVESEKARLNAEMLRATGGVVGSCTEVQLLVKWIRTQGVELKGLAKADVLDALKIEDMPPQVRKALLLRQEAAKSSTAKLTAMKQRASDDGRVRGTKQYHGASTGRWAGRGMQTDNYPKPRVGIEPEHVTDMIAHLGERAYLDVMYGPVMDALADTLRGMIVAKDGRTLCAADFSNIEGRVLAWLAGEEWKLRAFREYDAKTGPDLYLIAASKAYGRPASDFNKRSPEREVGKRCELAFGFGGGVGAWRKFETYATKDYVPFPDEQVNGIKTAWREAHSKLTYYWHDLECAAINAVQFAGTPCKAGAPHRQVTFKKAGSFLWCKLPSGRVLCYPYPEIRDIETPWGELKSALTFMTVLDDAKRKQGRFLEDPMGAGDWRRISTYGGSLAENVTQAVARDLLRDAIFRLEEAGYEVVMHVHDEVVCEVDSRADHVEKIETIMCQVPPWAAGLPVTAEGWTGKRYRK